MNFYADKSSIKFLKSKSSKALLVGSDFGYGNFGDILQHQGAIDRVKKCTSMGVISVLALGAISRYDDIEDSRRTYGADAVVFFSVQPISAETERDLGLFSVSIINGISFVQLYGGGFLNESWGDYVLAVAEYFLMGNPQSVYLVSGQQVSEGYSGRFAEHIEKFKPSRVGVRDNDSLLYLKKRGVDVDFSFDDAVESLISLSSKIIIEKGDGLFLHLNSSDYTGNSSEISEILDHLRVLSGKCGNGKVVLFQAFQDGREEVVDSIETVKRFDGVFPFGAIDVLMLVSLLKGAAIDGNSEKLVVGNIGYTCSYHVTLWLQLNGVPCWLRGSNGYYDQKRRALGINVDFDEFLSEMPVTDHSQNLAARAKWLHSVDCILSEVVEVESEFIVPVISSDSPRLKFNYKGEPRISSRLDETWSALLGVREGKEALLETIECLNSDLSIQTEKNRNEISIFMENVEGLRKNFSDLSLRSDQERAAFVDEIGFLKSEINSLFETSLKEISYIRDFSTKKHEELMSSLAFRDRLLSLSLENEKRLISQLEGFSDQVTYLGSECRAASYRISFVEKERDDLLNEKNTLLEKISSIESVREEQKRHLARVSSDLEKLSVRFLACSDQLTLVGNEARVWRCEAERIRVSNDDSKNREYQFRSQLQEIYSSRSWRLTRPLRVISRYIRTGRFDPAGQVGLFEFSRILGSSLPLPKKWISMVGGIMRKLRRG